MSTSPTSYRPNSASVLLLRQAVAALLYCHANLSFGATNFPEASGTSLRPVETASAHGAIGGSLGLGLRRTVSDAGAIGNDETNAEHHTQRLLHIVHGLSWPIDLGVTIGIDDASDVLEDLSGYAQWTVFQDFRLPSLAIRGTIEGSLPEKNSPVTSLSRSLEILASHDFASFLSVFAGYSATYATIEFKRPDGLYATGTQDEVGPQLSDVKGSFRSFGLIIRPWPPYLLLGADISKNDRAENWVTVKIAVGM